MKNKINIGNWEVLGLVLENDNKTFFIKMSTIQDFLFPSEKSEVLVSNKAEVKADEVKI